jgi:hypothetical protein
VYARPISGHATSDHLFAKPACMSFREKSECLPDSRCSILTCASGVGVVARLWKSQTFFFSPQSCLNWLETQTNREDLVCPNWDFESVYILRNNRLVVSFDCICGDYVHYR